MESKKTEIVSTMEELKASKREIEAQHAILGDVISTLETRISTLETQLQECPSPQIWDKFVDSASCRFQLDDTPTFEPHATVDLTVVGPDGKTAHMMMRANEKMKGVMKSWCLCMHEKPIDIIFLYKGHLLESNSTPQKLHMEDGDEILAERRWV